MKKLALGVALAAIATGAVANERTTLGAHRADGSPSRGAELKTMLDKALANVRDDGSATKSGKRYFEFDSQPAR
ncbi:MAG TPA: hypothetical protein VNE00_27655 [Paraburkholderia sp.]|jgi:hypothetical protein|nr:hypothetical protein [Paraburkholderia sp.]